jgi:tryptophan-rich sensory protein
VQAIGDTWNYINNAEKNLGFSVVVNWLCVWTSAVLLNVLYFQTLETAGWVLFPMIVWLTVAAKLVRDIWAINGKESLLPMKSA